MDRGMSESSKRGETAAVGPVDKQKMIQELKGMNMYEDNMPTDEMTQLLRVVKESTKSLSNLRNKIPNELITEDCPLPAIQPCYSQAVNANSASMSQRNSVSPELSPNQHSNSQEKRNDSSEECLFASSKRNPYLKDSPVNINKTRLLINENTFETTNENKRSVSRMNSQLRHEEKFPKWKINPLDYISNDKDMPLRSRFSPPSNRDKESFKTSVHTEMAIAQLSLHLQKLSDSRRAERRTQYGSTWGAGIKASTTIGSSDEKDIEDERTEVVESPTETNENFVDELPSGRKRRACVKLHAYGEIADNNSDDDFKVHEKKRKATKPTAILRESSNFEEKNLNIHNESSKKHKHPDSDDDYNFEAILDDSDEEVTNVTKKKKAKPSNEKKIATPRTTRKKNIETVSADGSKDNFLEKEDETPICIEDSDEITICEDADTTRPINKIKKSVSAEATSSTSSYPRRIIPPNPWNKYAGIRARKPLHSNASQVNKQPKQNNVTSNEHFELLVETNENNREVASAISRGKSKVSLQDDGILDALDSDEETSEEPSSSNQSHKIPLRLSSRMKNQCELLRAESLKDKEAECNRQEERKIKEEASDRLKQERVRQRLRAEAEKLKVAEIEEKRKSAMQEQWRTRVKAKEKEKQRQAERSELNPEGPRNSNDSPTVEVLVENPYATNGIEGRAFGNNRRGRDSPFEETSCPICSRKFPVAEIEAHAASCEEFDAVGSPGGSRSNSPAFPPNYKIPKRRNAELFECDTCSSYRAKDGRDFEQHVISCLARLKDGEASGSGTIVSVPDSPIRTLRRNSEQTDSEINYNNQFPSKTRAKTTTGVKRKR